MMATRRPFWLVHAELPAAITVEAWTCEALALGFSAKEAMRLCWWRWMASLDPERIERREAR